MFDIFDKLGGEDAALEILAIRAGEKPGLEAVRMWKRVGRIPAIKAIELIEECRVRNIEVVWPHDFRAVPAGALDYVPSSEEAAE